MRTAIITGLLLLGAATARAQTTPPDSGTPGSPGSGGLGLSKGDFSLEFKRKDGNEWKFMNATTLDTFFNRARCLCKEEVQAVVRLQPAAQTRVGSAKNTVFRLRAGDNQCVCTGTNCQTAKCKDLGQPGDIVGLVSGPRELTFTFNVRDVFDVDNSGADTACDKDEAQNVWIWYDSDDSGTDPDLTDASFPIKIDGRGPPAPTGVTVAGGNQALDVKWESIGQDLDLQGYQVLCARGGELPPFEGRYTAGYDDTTSCQGMKKSAAPGAVAVDVPTGALAVVGPSVPGPAPAPIAGLDARFLCSELLTSGTSARISKVENGIPYVVGVVAIDKRRNASPLMMAALQYPTPTKDFYSGYRDAGGGSEGGCAFGGAAGMGAGGLAGLGLIGLGLLAWARRTGRPGGGR